MSRKYKFQDSDKLYFVTFSVIEWIDLFIRNEYKKILIDSFRYCIEKKGMELYAYCIMTSHVHMIIGTNKESMQNIMRDLKRHTSEMLHKAIAGNPKESRRVWLIQMMTNAGINNSNNCGFQLWQQDNHPIVLFSSKILHQKLNYIHNNPVVAGFVDNPEDWAYSSAKDYLTGKCRHVEIIFIEPELVTY